MKRRRGAAEQPSKASAGPPAPPVQPAGPAAATPTGLARYRFVRWVASLWALLHFTAIVAAAASSGPTYSGLVGGVWTCFRPYLQIFYLNHGYQFFAPEPAPSTLLDFEVEAADGTIVARGRVPDSSLRPRLLYQRYLLLTEHIAVAPPMLQKHWYISYARHLCRRYGAAKVRLTRLTHYAPTMEMFKNGTPLDDPVNYREESLGTFSCADY
jgi:hypothetical protein